jgi:photoactive yellow protein
MKPFTQRSSRLAGVSVFDRRGLNSAGIRPIPDRLFSSVPSPLTMTQLLTLSFEDPQLASALSHATAEELDGLDFGVIGFDGDGVVRTYNAFESQAAGLAVDHVKGHPLFTVVAPCMNNYLVAQRFDDAASAGSTLDATINYVLTLRMRPVKVKLRLLAQPGAQQRYVLVHRRV